MDFVKVDLEKVNLQELLLIMNKNHTLAIQKNEEIEKMNNFTNSKSTLFTIEEPKKEINVNNENIKVNIDFEKKIEGYLQELKKISLDNIDEKMSQILPEKEDYDYTRIIYRLQLEELKELYELEEFMKVEKDNLSLDDKEEFELEKLLEEKKLLYLKNALLPEEEKDEIIENNLIFVPTTGGNIRVLNELMAVPLEYRENFLEILKSIKEGTFKNAKRFYNNANMTKIMEVRGFQTRILYERIAKNTYSIITAFIKKTNSDRGYLESIYQKAGDYFNIKEKIKSLLNDEEFLRINKQYEEEIFNLLQKKNEKAKEKVKNDD